MEAFQHAWLSGPDWRNERWSMHVQNTKVMPTNLCVGIITSYKLATCSEGQAKMPSPNPRVKGGRREAATLYSWIRTVRYQRHGILTMALRIKVKSIDCEISAAKHARKGRQHQSRSTLSGLSTHSSTQVWRPQTQYTYWAPNGIA